MKKMSLGIIISLIVLCSGAQDFISIVGSVPYPVSTKVYFEGYEGFSPEDLGNIRVSDNGEIDFFTDYHGYCKMHVPGQTAWPLILEYDPTCLEWKGGFSFACDPENEVFYKFLPALDYNDSLLLAFRNSSDSLELIELRAQLDIDLNELGDKLNSLNNSPAGIFLKGEFLIHNANATDSLNSIAIVKEEILLFVQEHYEQLYHSDYLIRLARAYTDMNKRGFSRQETAKAASIYDVGEWHKTLSPLMEERAIIDFFMEDFLADGNIGVAADLAEKYAEIVKCEQYVNTKLRPATMPYSFNVFGGADMSKMYALDQFSGMPKILALYSAECPASIAALAGLYEFVKEKQLRVPVILTPDGEIDPQLIKLLQKVAPFGLQTGAKTGGSLMMGAGIKQLPAFIVLDRNNLLKDIYYDLGSLKTDFSKE